MKYYKTIKNKYNNINTKKVELNHDLLRRKV